MLVDMSKQMQKKLASQSNGGNRREDMQILGTPKAHGTICHRLACRVLFGIQLGGHCLKSTVKATSPILRRQQDESGHIQR